MGQRWNTNVILVLCVSTVFAVQVVTVGVGADRNSICATAITQWCGFTSMQMNNGTSDCGMDRCMSMTKVHEHDQNM